MSFPGERKPLDILFAPRSIAVVGVSQDPAALGSMVHRYLRNSGFAGRIHAIGRNLPHDKIECHPSLADLPEPVDLIFLSIPAEAAIAVMPECAAAGARVVIVAAAGFAEDGDRNGIDRQQRLQQAAAACGVRIVGPNCNGLWSAKAQLSLGFNTGHSRAWAQGRVAIVSHSGALFDSMAQSLVKAGGGLAAFISTGNEADFDTLDYLEHMIGEPSVGVVALLIDAIPDGDRLRRLALRAASLDKAIVALKIGSSAIGAEAATAHSSRLAGNGEAYRALFRASGIAVAETIEGLMASAALLARFGKARGGLAAISSSGAGCSLLADRAERHRVELPRLSPATKVSVEQYRRFSNIANPADLGAFVSPVGATAAFSIMASDPDVGMLTALMHSFLPPLRELLAERLAASACSSGKPLIIIAPGGLPREEVDCYAAHGLPVFDDTDVALQAIAAVLSPPPTQIAGPTAPAPPLPDRALNEQDSLALLSNLGIPTVASILCSSGNEAVRGARALGVPVVLKASVEGMVHKSDAGLVFLGLNDEDEVRAAYEACGPSARVLIQPMLSSELELIVGLSRSPGTGLTLMTGLGGIHAEALGSVTMWAPPVSRDDIVAGLKNSALGRLLHGPRWRYPEQIEQLLRILLDLQDFGLAAGDALEAVDINPLLMGPSGVVAVDASIIPARKGMTPSGSPRAARAVAWRQDRKDAIS